MMKTVTCIEDLRQIARRRVPRAFFDYVEAGSYAQETLRANHADLQRHRLRQRVLIDVSARDTAATFVGESCPCHLPWGRSRSQDFCTATVKSSLAAPRMQPAVNIR